ncbi:hypothetical protein H8356DRAFT_1337912 [Neocallimastix lanati (nom. inval.)]|nr:hypothetical protein H8356DRAFT_1337912 [Neocallimastix sp. JGI-2020a]
MKGIINQEEVFWIHPYPTNDLPNIFIYKGKVGRQCFHPFQKVSLYEKNKKHLENKKEGLFSSQSPSSLFCLTREKGREREKERKRERGRERKKGPYPFPRTSIVKKNSKNLKSKNQKNPNFKIQISSCKLSLNEWINRISKILILFKKQSVKDNTVSSLPPLHLTYNKEECSLPPLMIIVQDDPETPLGVPVPSTDHKNKNSE